MGTSQDQPVTHDSSTMYGSIYINICVYSRLLADFLWSLPRVPLNNDDISLAYRCVRNQGSVLKAGSSLVRNTNAECGHTCKPRRARPEAHIYGVVLLMKGRAIHCEARLVAARFRSRRDISALFRGTLEFYFNTGNRIRRVFCLTFNQAARAYLMAVDQVLLDHRAA